MENLRRLDAAVQAHRKACREQGDQADAVHGGAIVAVTITVSA
jgi:hypothetical protein